LISDTIFLAFCLQQVGQAPEIIHAAKIRRVFSVIFRLENAFR
jgi:hypothetical protein